MVKKTRQLFHPLLDVPATAVERGVWSENGRTAGIVLEFPDGHVTSLTFGEIRKLEEVLTHEEIDDLDNNNRANRGRAAVLAGPAAGDGLQGPQLGRCYATDEGGAS